MKRFRFRLEKILGVRRVEEDQAVFRLRQAAARLQEIDARIQVARQDHAEVFRELAEALRRGALRPGAPVEAAAHASRLERGIREAERERVEALQSLKQAELELRRRRTARRALEELESRAASSWKDDVRREENAFLDEVASIRHARSS
jgi:flagellar export protein FliJ